MLACFYKGDLMHVLQKILYLNSMFMMKEFYLFPVHKNFKNI